MDKCNKNEHTAKKKGENKKPENKSVFAAFLNETSKSAWYIDSGTSSHMTPDVYMGHKF